MKFIDKKIFSNLDPFFKISFTLFIMLPIAMITGPFLSDLIVISLLILFLYKFSKINFYRSNFIFFFLILIISLYFFINHFYLNKFDQNYLKSLFYFRFFLLIPIGILVFNNLEKIRFLMYLIIIINFIIVFDLIFQKIFGFNILGISAIQSFNEGMHFKTPVVSLDKVTRFSGFFGNELIAGGYLSKFFFVSLFFLYFEMRKNKFYNNFKFKNFVLIFYITTILTGILLSGERTALISSLMYILIFFIYCQCVEKKSRFYLLFFSIITSILLIILTSTNFKSRYIDSTINELFFKDKTGNIEYKFKNLSENKHISHYLAAIDLSKRNIIFGSGFKNFRNLCDSKKFICSTHPHNSFLEILSSLGIIGVLLFYGIFYVFYYLFLKNKISSIDIKLYFLYIILGFAFILPTGSIFNNFYSILAFFQVMSLIVVLKNYSLITSHNYE